MTPGKPSSCRHCLADKGSALRKLTNPERRRSWQGSEQTRPTQPKLAGLSYGKPHACPADTQIVSIELCFPPCTGASAVQLDFSRWLTAPRRVGQKLPRQKKKKNGCALTCHKDAAIGSNNHRSTGGAMVPAANVHAGEQSARTIILPAPSSSSPQSRPPLPGDSNKSRWAPARRHDCDRATSPCGSPPPAGDSPAG